MDVAFGLSDVPISKKYLVKNNRLVRWVHFFSLLTVLLLGQIAVFADLSEPIHFSGDRQIWNRKSNEVELFGHAAVIQTSETLTADYVHLNLKTRILDARGDCVYVAPDALIFGDAMHFNIDTHTGTIYNGRVANDKFNLRGTEIHKLGAGRFQTQNSSYTTCQDCAASWTLDAEHVDMQVEDYAYLSNVIPRIKDSPAFWIPYLVLPMKTRRQSGVLFPKMALSGSNGPMFVLPYFWSINRSMDMTLGLGEYTQRGHRIEWEGRYVVNGESSGKLTYNFLNDRQFGPSSTRWVTDTALTQSLPWSMHLKLRFSEVGDNLYPFYFPDDIPGIGGEAFMRSTLSVSHNSPGFSTYIAVTRNRNLLNTAPGDPIAQQIQFDPHTVQVLPSAVLTTNDKQLFGSQVFGGLTLGFSNFTRTAGPFDYDNSNVAFGSVPPYPLPPYQPGVDPIRQATRFSVNPLIYTSFRPFDIMSVVPSVQYLGYFYNFSNVMPNLRRGYLLFQTDIAAQLERVYQYPDDDKIPRAKHIIRPTLTYSLIPVINDNAGHPFVQQIQNAQNNSILGYNFDDYDIVPYTYNQSGANYFTPLGNSLAYGFVTQWIRRKGAVNLEAPTYQTALEWSAGQALNFLELNNINFLTRFYSTLNFNFEQLQSATTYYYYTNPPVTATSRHTLSTGLTYIIERSTHQRIMVYDRSLTLGYVYSELNGQTSNLSATLNFSINDYLFPFGSLSYGFEPKGQLYGATCGLKIQSPSQCWSFTSTAGFNPAQNISVGFDFSLNLTGAGFSGFTELANSASTFSQQH